MKFQDHDPTRHEDLLLTGKGIFENIPPSELEELREAGEWGWASMDEMILETDQEQEFLYVVVQGSVHVYRTHFRSGREQPLADLFEGECFGEMAFLGEGKATANIKAKERSLLWRLDHNNLMEYLSDYKGAGQMCLNLAAILAHRLKEGNTKLNGLSGGLSAYFGLKSRLAAVDVEPPVSADEAELELAPAIMSSFVRETLRLPPDTDVSMEQIELVEESLRNQKVDIVHWLESGASGHRLKLKLHFVDIDKDGNEIVDEYIGYESTIPVAAASTMAKPQGTPKAKLAAGSATKRDVATGKAGKKGLAKKTTRKPASNKERDKGQDKKRRHLPPPQEEEESSLLKKLLFPAACGFFLWLLSMIAILLIPGPTKAGWVLNEDGKVNGLMRTVLFPTSKLPFGQQDKKWTEPFSWDLSRYAMEKGWLEIQLEVKQPLEEDIELLIYVQDPDGKNLLSGNNSRTKYLLRKGEKRWEILNHYIGEGESSKLALELDFSRNARPGKEWEKGKVKLKVFR